MSKQQLSQKMFFPNQKTILKWNSLVGKTGTEAKYQI
jgi:hypothetical protein